MTTIRDLMGLPSLAQMHLVAGAGGLDNTVLWPYVILCPPISQWVSGGEFLIYYGANQFVESVELKSLIREGAANNAGGILLLVGEHFITEQSIDAELCACADELNFPVFTITSRAYVNSITKDIIAFIQNQNRLPHDTSEFWFSLFFEHADTDELATLDRALYLGYLPNCQYRVYIIKFMNADEYFRKIKDITKNLSENHTEFFRMLAMKISFMLSNYTDHPWHIGSENENILVFQANTLAQEASVENFLTMVCDRLEDQHPGATFAVGKGMKYPTLSGIRQSFIEARRCLMAHTLADERRIISYTDLGFYQLIYEIPHVNVARDFSNRYIGKLIEYDQEHGTEIFDTLCCYIDCRANKVQTAKAMYLHRNTLQMRLDKAASILEVDIDDAHNLFNLQIAVYIRRFFDETHFL